MFNYYKSEKNQAASQEDFINFLAMSTPDQHFYMLMEAFRKTVKMERRPE